LSWCPWPESRLPAKRKIKRKNFCAIFGPFQQPCHLPVRAYPTAHTRPLTRGRENRQLMEAWAAYCEPKTNANVMHIHKK